MTEETMLTTIDNPFNPFTQYNQWYAYDTSKGYNTTSYQARITDVSDDLDDKDFEAAVRSGIDEIIEMNILGIYCEIDKNGNKSFKGEKI